MKKKILLWLILITISMVFQPVHSQSWMWAKGGGTTPNAGSNYVTVNTNGYIYCLGGYKDSVSFDNSTYIKGPPSGFGTNFIVVYTGEGTYLYHTTIGLLNQQPGGGYSILGMNNNYQGDIFIVGDIGGSVYFDTLRVSASTGYLTKFNPGLDALSIKRVSDAVFSVSFDEQHNRYVAGNLYSALSYIDTFSLYNPSQNPLFNPKMYLAKLDSTGQCLWVKQGWGGNSQLSKCVYNNNSLYLIGRIDSCATLDTTKICGTSSNSSGFFIARTTPNGDVKWKSTQTKVGINYGSTISIDGEDNCYSVGLFDSSLILSGNTLVKIPNSGRNGFFAKYDSSGYLLWLKHINCSGEITLGISTNSQGISYISGNFSGTLIFGTDTIPAQSASDMFIARFDANGNYIGSKVVPNAHVRGITQDSSGNAIVTGEIRTGTTYFDDIPITASGVSNFFVAKLSAITTGIETIVAEEDGQLDIFPNPNRKTFRIAVPEGLIHAGKALMGIYDNSGKSVNEEWMELNQKEASVDLGMISKGIYTVVLSAGKKRYTGRVVME